MSSTVSLRFSDPPPLPDLTPPQEHKERQRELLAKQLEREAELKSGCTFTPKVSPPSPLAPRSG
jgi:hypothetical protein